jgi:hypothetical protein
MAPGVLRVALDLGPPALYTLNAPDENSQEFSLVPRDWTLPPRASRASGPVAFGVM